MRKNIIVGGHRMRPIKEKLTVAICCENVAVSRRGFCVDFEVINLMRLSHGARRLGIK